jgi:hypothetical protein
LPAQGEGDQRAGGLVAAGRAENGDDLLLADGGAGVARWFDQPVGADQQRIAAPQRETLPAALRRDLGILDPDVEADVGFDRLLDADGLEQGLVARLSLGLSTAHLPGADELRG